MKRKIIQLNSNERNVIAECIRRIQYFKNGNMTANLLMLSNKSTIKTLIEKDILKLSGTYSPRCYTWSHLTKRGLRIMRQLKRKGLFSLKEDYNGKTCGIIPPTIIIYEKS